MTDRIKDPYLPWSGPFPYEHLDGRLREVGRPGLGFDASADEVLDCFDDLMAAGAPTAEDQQAWDALRLTERRLVLDFFLYRLEGEAADLARGLRRVAPPPATEGGTPDAFDLGPEPPGVAIDPARFEPPVRGEP